MSDRDQYDRICAKEFDSLRGGIRKIEAMLEDQNKRLFIGNGQEALCTRVARMEERLAELRKHKVTPGSGKTKVAVGGVSLATLVGLVIERLLHYFGGGSAPTP